MPSAFLAAGTTRYATAASTGSQQLWDGAGWQNLTGMTKYITVPGGQTADVMVIFCTEANATSGNSFEARVYVGGQLASPQSTVMQMAGQTASQCAVFFKSGVPAGTPAVKIQGQGSGTLATLDDRTMIVIANLH